MIIPIYLIKDFHEYLLEIDLEIMENIIQRFTKINIDGGKYKA